MPKTALAEVRKCLPLHKRCQAVSFVNVLGCAVIKLMVPCFQRFGMRNGDNRQESGLVRFESNANLGPPSRKFQQDAVFVHGDILQIGQSRRCVSPLSERAYIGK